MLIASNSEYITDISLQDNSSDIICRDSNTDVVSQRKLQ